jgi:hypothetical protein
MVDGYVGSLSIGLYLYVFVMIMVTGVLVVAAYKMRWRRVWVIGVGLGVLVVFGIGIFPFSAYVLIGSGWPGMYVYTEQRSFGSPEGGVALRTAETFDYSLISVSETTNLSDASFYQGTLEYSLLPVSGANFLTNKTLAHYTLINDTFNPYLVLGRRALAYIANCTYFSTLSVQLNTATVDPLSFWPVLVTANNDTFLKPLETLPFYGNVYSFWRGGFWNGSDYVGFEYALFDDYFEPMYLWLNYTDVYLVDLRLTIDRTGAGASGRGDGFRFYQLVIVDQLGRVLFVSYHDRYYAWVM